MSDDKLNTISVDQLQIGVYVYLDVGWMHHPFSFNNFKIRTEDQLATIRQLGLSHVRWDPARSDMKPLPAGAQGAGKMSTPAVESAALEANSRAAEGAAVDEAPSEAAVSLMASKHERIRKLGEHREKISRTEKAFLNAANVVRGINKTIFSAPKETLEQTGELIGQMADDLLAAPDLAIQVMSEKPGSEDVYFHSLNVSVLAMIIGREMSLPAELVRAIGVGSLFHDIGLNEVPARIINNPGTLTKPEREFREMHCQYGFDIGKKVGLPAPALNIVFQHHEYFDGAGYPRKLKGETIDLLARLVCVVNIYDNLCNPVSIANAQTPHEALSQMFAQHRNKFDPRLLQVFIRFMGVYPPGTVVGLSNDAVGLVIKVNSARPLRPTVIVYDAGVPKSEAILLDLDEEPDINISRAIRPAQLPPAVYDYLSPRRRVSYFFDGGSPAGA